MYCGGEVPAKSTKCPYCGRENQSGIAFEREVREKEARNRALGDEILKKNLPWLTQKMLTRIIVVTAVLNVVLFFSTFLMFLWSDRAPAVKEAKAGSAAERYLRNFETEDYYCGNFIESMNDYIGAKTDGTEMEAYHIESMVRHGFYLAQQIYDDKMGAEEKEEAAALLEAFFADYVGLPEEYRYFYRTEEWSTGDYEQRTVSRDAAVSWLCEKEGVD